jgi:pimeloyl-ACP methyl ester carboxylesterase
MDKVTRIEGHQIITSLSGDPNNPPIILIHGWMSHRGVWQQTIRALEGKYYCISLDLLGFGASDKPEDADYSLPAQAQRVLKLADQLGFSHFSLIGHSMGAQIAMYIAAVLAPPRVDKLLSVGGVFTGELSDKVTKTEMLFVRLARRVPALYGIGLSLVDFRPFINWTFGSWFYDMKALPLEAWKADRVIAFNRASAIPNDEAGKSIQATNLIKYLHKITGPTLLIHGEDDAVVPVEQATLAQDVIPNHNLALFKKCGHFPMYEKPNQYLKALAMIFP